MWRQNDCVARLDGDQDFENSSGSGIGGGNDSGYNSARAGDFNDVFRLGHYTDSSQLAKIIPNVFSRETVFLAFVISNSVTSLLNCHGAQASCVTERRSSHRLTDSVDLSLIETSHLALGPVCRFDKIACLLNRDKVFICRHKITSEAMAHCRLPMGHSIEAMGSFKSAIGN